MTSTGRTGAELTPAPRPSTSWFKSPPKMAASIVSGLVTAGGILIGIYPDPVRTFLDENWPELLAGTGALAVLLGAVYVSFRAGGRRIRERLVMIDDKSYVIGSEVAVDIVGPDAVAGRPIRYLERMTDSPELVVLIHGLGLDANDFRGYLAETQYHCIAFTMFGFDQRDRHDVRFGLISLDSHMAIIESFLVWLRTEYPGKRLHLVGFSFGADILMFLAERSRARGERLADSVVLLDPNVNRSSMFISTSICQLDITSPLGALKKLLEGAASLIEFQNLCEYLYKVCSKNLAQVQRLACDVRGKWEESGYSQFLARLAEVDARARRVSVVFSFHYEQHFNELVRASGQVNLAVTRMQSTEFDHFQLIGSSALHRQLDSVVRSSSSLAARS